MKKISTLFKKNTEDFGRVINDINPENQWVFDGYGIPTRKFDGTAMAIIDGNLYKRYDVKPNKKLPLKFMVGNVVCKKSAKPFKNGELTNEIVELCINPQSPISAPAAKLKNSDTIVNLDMLSIVGNWSMDNFKEVPKNAIPCQEPDPITGHYPHWIPCDRRNPADKWAFIAFDLLENKLDGTYELCGERVQGNPENIEGHILIPHGIEKLPITDFSFESIRAYLSNPEPDIEGIVFHHKDKKDVMCKIRKSDFGVKRVKR